MELNSTTISYNNEPAAFIILRDQSEKLKAEQALRESEEKYKETRKRWQAIATMNDRDRFSRLQAMRFGGGL